ncbi:NUMOD4 domain-containing protein [Domibacillus enclensis]|uniref:NUMOD4 motif-containing protein n=1 Tax=Domibacillus enclensis TaxID=1017273 RepID=A0A1N6S3W1_9BACI|nr:NUMOD4 domain-containing protein [Domibacillus enclensis]OXS79212.1 hypothetical protein B1B05_05420 [Domibacillus enclensis]SIQ35784.1 NUMOD4 motif-containing protein [Domibacillus enclensis]
MEEQWKVLKYNPNYVVSNLGRVRNNKSGRILSNRPDNKGYCRISINVDGKYKDFKIHRLVAENFILNDKPHEKTEINHIDGVKSNNSFLNLEWITPSQNMKHAFKSGLHSHVGEKNSNLTLSDESVLKIWSSDLTPKQVAEKYNISYGYATRLVKKQVRRYLLESD